MQNVIYKKMINLANKKKTHANISGMKQAVRTYSRSYIAKSNPFISALVW